MIDEVFAETVGYIVGLWGNPAGKALSAGDIAVIDVDVVLAQDGTGWDRSACNKPVEEDGF